ncbi:hypothetical protein [Hyphomicrobium sp.]|uniref:hypothetical protein n=1 Tax=Hyphomicrobium sp. TaxID=82 RepID=UPI0025C49415|nr:hypothetical protein [Hyphomicrobium sp.]MCC7253818.1 hypothetical protein [Hyphomicrobium sp.]
MRTRFLIAATFGTLALVSAPIDADAGRKKPSPERDRAAVRDCTPVNGPYGYYGNPWCDDGYKQAEDYPPGAGGYFDVFDLPQVRRLTRRWD